MTATIDASALAAYLLEEEGVDAIRTALAEGTASPELVAKEVSNAALGATKSGRLSREEATELLDVLLMLTESNVRLFPQADLMRDAFRISLKHSLTIYDSVYIALARKLRGPLLSRDARQLAAAEAEGVQTQTG